MNKRIYLVRHDSTAGNEQNVHQTASTPLSESGLAQARILGERFVSLPADVIIASPMKRAQQTAAAIVETTGLPLVKSDLLVEMSAPSAVQEKPHNEPGARSIMNEIFRNFTNEAFRHSDEETFWDLRTRAEQAIDMLLARPEGSIIVVTHGLTLKMMFSIMLYGENLTPDIYAKVIHFFKNTNTGITICEHEEGRIPTIAHDQTDWHCITFNDHAHLG